MEVESELCQYFIDFLKHQKISHNVYNKGYHIQVMRIHNFYPTKNTYYNSDTGKKGNYPKFEKHSDFTNFLNGSYDNNNELKMTFSKQSVIDILLDCKDLQDAINTFQNI